MSRVLFLKINYALLYRIYKYGLNCKRFNLKERGRHGLLFLVHVCGNLKKCLSISLKFSGMASTEAKNMATLKDMQFCILLSLFLRNWKVCRILWMIGPTFNRKQQLRNILCKLISSSQENKKVILYDLLLWWCNGRKHPFFSHFWYFYIFIFCIAYEICTLFLQ